MKLIIGLGNLGEKYKNNRHNVGYMVADYSKKTKVFKTNTFMNDSGSFVSSQLKKTDIDFSKLYIIHDDLDIKLGEYKIQFGKGPKDHNGLNDIYNKLGTKDFWHIRIGVDNRDTMNRISGEEYILQDFTDQEKIILEKVTKEICKKLETL
ncbi:MAG TPA: aminoacyl-tRNA hydrolase [Patescibacteria group bacterium]|nr:aminoacyl-tRNA hydrolase [Patescibacteria group bacterium]